MTTGSQPEPGKRFDITLAGETNLDLILYGLPEIMPVERELLASNFKMTLGGSSSILAHNLAALGSRVGFVTRVGDDEMGAIALARLAEAGVELSHATRIENKVTGVTIVLPHESRRHMLTYLGVMEEMKVSDFDMAYITSSRHFHISSLFLQTGLQRDLPLLFRRLKELGMTLSLDTNDDPADRWGGVLEELLDLTDVFLPNEDEVKRITGADTLEGALETLLGRVPVVVVKCGARGAVVQQHRSLTWIEARAVRPVDTIGAGDSFNAGFLHAFAQGQDPVMAAKLGVATGALSTLRSGGTEAFRDAPLVEDFLAGTRFRNLS